MTPPETSGRRPSGSEHPPRAADPTSGARAAPIPAAGPGIEPAAHPGDAVPSRRLLGPTAWAAVGAAMAVASCARVGGGAGGAATPAGDLSALHERVRVEGLDDRRFDHAAFWGAVDDVLEGAEHLRVEPVGESAEGRAIRRVTFGSGRTSVLLWSQMHGDESTATMALADVYAFIERVPDHPVARVITRELTVHTIPMLNPDGAQRFQRRNAQGIDVNRDARRLATPEGQVLKAVRDRVEPAWGFNLHDQNVGTRVGDTDRGVAIALLAPPPDGSGDPTEVQGRAMKLAGVIRGAVETLVADHVARYDDTFNPRAFGDLMTQWGTSTVLIESGGWEDDPQKQYLRRTNFVALLAALESIARGTWQQVAEEVYLGLPGNGRSVGDLLVTGGTLAVPGLPPVRADLLIDYEQPLERTGGVIAEIGDLAEAEARDTLSAEGLYLVPSETALERQGGTQIQPGARAEFVAARDPEGNDVVWTFQGRARRD